MVCFTPSVADWITMSRLFLIAFSVYWASVTLPKLISLATLIVVAVPFWRASISPLASVTVAARTTKDDPERYNYHIDNRNNRIKLHSYILDTTKNASGELLVSDFDSSTMHATFKGSPSWEIDDQSDYNLHFKLTKIGTVK